MGGITTLGNMSFPAPGETPRATLAREGDLARTRTIDAAMLKSRADYSVYEGWAVTGWPVMTLSRGEVVFADDVDDGVTG